MGPIHCYSEVLNFVATMTITKTVVEKFDRNVNFGIWQLKMEAILVQNGVDLAIHGIEKKPESVKKQILLRWIRRQDPVLS